MSERVGKGQIELGEWVDRQREQGGNVGEERVNGWRVSERVGKGLKGENEQERVQGAQRARGNGSRAECVRGRMTEGKE